MRRTSTLFAALLFAFVASPSLHAQEVKTAPGQFDYYLLNLSWAPEFCDNLKTLSDSEREHIASDEQLCSTPHAFALHGLWTQNIDGTYPGYCGDRPGPVHPERNLDLTPNLALLRHEWSKHGTCTTLSPEAFFATARQAYNAVAIPALFKRVDHEVQLTPDTILGLFQQANPAFPKGSFALSCAHNRLSAIEACFSKDLRPIACQNLKSCGANVVTITPENSGGIVQ